MTPDSDWIVLVVAHGTVADLDDLPEFLSRIRRGNPPPTSLVAALRERYQAIGGSPLLAATEAQARALQAACGLETRVAMRLWHPLVEDVLADLHGERRVCVVSLAPFSKHVYDAAAAKSVQGMDQPLALVSSEEWFLHPLVIDAWARGVERHLDTQRDQCVVLSAHSLPRRVVDCGDPYQAHFEAACGAVASRLGRDVKLAYQSQGARGGDWLGPDLDDVMDQCRHEGHRGVVVAPIGFAAEHVETLYDLDIEARRHAEKIGLRFERTPTLGEDGGFIRALADIVAAAIRRSDAVGSP